MVPDGLSAFVVVAVVALAGASEASWSALVVEDPDSVEVTPEEVASVVVSGAVTLGVCRGDGESDDGQAQRSAYSATDSGADDSVGSDDAELQIHQVHGATHALAVAISAAKDLGHHAPEVCTLGDHVAMSAVGCRDRVIGTQFGARADGRGFLSDREVDEAR